MNFISIAQYLTLPTGEYPLLPVLNPLLPAIVDLITDYASSLAFLNFLFRVSFSSSSFLIIYALSAKSTLSFSRSALNAYTFFAI